MGRQGRCYRATPVHPYNLRHRCVAPTDTHTVASRFSLFATEPFSERMGSSTRTRRACGRSPEFCLGRSSGRVARH
jgi:hypothetical protein